MAAAAAASQVSSPPSPPPPRRTVAGRPLPDGPNALLHHLQEQTLRTPSERMAQRLVRFFQCLVPQITEDGEAPRAQGTVDLCAIRQLCGEGVPDDVPALRAVLWKVMLGYLPADVFQWDVAREGARASYWSFVRELQEQLSHPAPDSDCQAQADEPSENSASVEGVLGQVAKDIVRTRVELDFFGRRIDGKLEHGCCAGRDPDSIDVVRPLFHHDVLARVLLLYAQLNPGVLYVQGMNELAAPLYYAFSQDPLVREEDAEVDTFFCFALLMSDMRDAFVQSLDDSDNGMLGRIDHFSKLLQRKDQQLWEHLEARSVFPVYYCMRWITLMLAQEHEMPDLLHLWDALLSDLATGQQMLLLYICVAMVVRVRDVLLASDFTDCLKLLQRYPPVPVDELLEAAVALRSVDMEPTSGKSSSTKPAVGPAAKPPASQWQWRLPSWR